MVLHNSLFFIDEMHTTAAQKATSVINNFIAAINNL